MLIQSLFQPEFDFFGSQADVVAKVNMGLAIDRNLLLSAVWGDGHALLPFD